MRIYSLKVTSLKNNQNIKYEKIRKRGAFITIYPLFCLHIELDKQTGAPAEIIVNGQLLAYGDVIVVGDNFGIRVTEIVGAKELLDSLGNSL